jgi:acetyl esterase/lipase
MKISASILAMTCLAVASNVGAASPDWVDRGNTHAIVRLWPGAPPGSKPSTLPEAISHEPRTALVRNVTMPTLTVFLPEPAQATGTAVIVAPGGAYIMLAIDHEGYDVAQWLAARGIAAFVLKYRLAATPAAESDFQKMRAEQLRKPELLAPIIKSQAPISIADGKRAVKIVRSRAAEWGIAPNRIGIVGFSAGGGVASAAALDYAADERPDFAAPIYGVGDQRPVPADAPPLFIAAAADDPTIPAARSVDLFSRWRASGHAAELHVYGQGGHGFGMYPQGLPSDHWIEELYYWLQAQGFAKR